MIDRNRTLKTLEVANIVLNKKNIRCAEDIFRKTPFSLTLAYGTLDKLEEYGLIRREKVGRTKKIIVTDKGRKFGNHIKQILKILKED